MPGFRLFTAFVFAALLASLTGEASAQTRYSISGVVWFDANGNGNASVWEKKLARVTVHALHAVRNETIRTTTTDSSGKYTLPNMRPGAYRVRIIPPAGYTGVFTRPITVAANAVRNFPLNQPRSIEEKALNRFGDRWSLAKFNPSLRLAAGTGCYRKPAPGMSYTFTAEELKFLKTLKAKFYIEGCAIVLENDPPFANLTDYQTSDRLKAHVASLKAADPSMKYLAYQRFSDWMVGQVGWTDIYDNHRDWFVYKRGSTTKNDADVVMTTLDNARLLDLTNPAYQDYIVAKMAIALAYYNIDGIFIDSVAPLWRTVDVSEVPGPTFAGWNAAWVSFLTKLRAALGPNRYIFASVPQDNLIFTRNIIPLVDGIMLEDTFSPIRRRDVLGRVKVEQPTIDAAAAAGKWILTTQNTKVDGSTFTNTTPAKEHAYQRYYLAAFYIFNKGKMLYYYNPPAATSAQYAAEAFFTDWNIKVGGPRGPYTQVAPRVYKRNYGNSIIYLNSSDTPYKITVPVNSPFKFDPDGRAIKGYIIQPKNGFILSNAKAFQYP